MFGREKRVSNSARNLRYQSGNSSHFNRELPRERIKLRKEKEEEKMRKKKQRKEERKNKNEKKERRKYKEKAVN